MLLEKLEEKHKLIKYISELIPDKRDTFRTEHVVEKQNMLWENC